MSSEIDREFGSSDADTNVDTTKVERSKVLADLASLATVKDHTSTPAGEAVLALKGYDERQQNLHDLVAVLSPPTVVQSLWIDWLARGYEPTELTRMVKPANVDRATGKVFARADRAQANAAKKIAEAEKKVEAANEILRQARIEAEVLEANETAALLWTVQEHLVTIMQSIFAMGPAWTIMRSVSAYMSDEQLELAAASAFTGEEADDLKRRAMQQKKDATLLMLRVLDQFCGDPEFESEMRSAIEAVVVRFDKKGVNPTGPIYRRRGLNSLRTSVQNAGQKHREEILAGFDFE